MVALKKFFAQLDLTDMDTASDSVEDEWVGRTVAVNLIVGQMVEGVVKTIGTSGITLTNNNVTRFVPLTAVLQMVRLS